MNSDQKADFSPNISLNWHLILSISKFGRSCKVLWLCFVKEDFVLFCLLCQELLESYHRSTSIYYSKGNITSSVMAYSHINSRYYQQNGSQNVSQPRLGAVHTKMIGSLWLTVTQTSSGFHHWKKKKENDINESLNLVSNLQKITFIWEKNPSLIINPKFQDAKYLKSLPVD